MNIEADEAGTDNGDGLPEQQAVSPKGMK